MGSLVGFLQSRGRRTAKAVTSPNARHRRWVPQMKKIMPTLLDLNGAILLAVGANQIYAPAGWIVGGLAVLAINRNLHGD